MVGDFSSLVLLGARLFGLRVSYFAKVYMVLDFMSEFDAFIGVMTNDLVVFAVNFKVGICRWCFGW